MEEVEEGTQARGGGEGQRAHGERARASIATTTIIGVVGVRWMRVGGGGGGGGGSLLLLLRAACWLLAG